MSHGEIAIAWYPPDRVFPPAGLEGYTLAVTSSRCQHGTKFETQCWLSPELIDDAAVDLAQLLQDRHRAGMMAAEPCQNNPGRDG